MSISVRIFLLFSDFVQKLNDYLLMLVVMTFNGWLLLAVVFGLTIGYSLHQVESDFIQTLKSCGGDAKVKNKSCISELRD